MRVSERGLQFIAAREALVLTAHRDTTSLAIGFGQNDATLAEGDTISTERAIALLIKFAETLDKSIAVLLPGLEIAQPRYDAVHSAFYNIGPSWMRDGNRPFLDAIADHAGDPGNRDDRERAGAAFMALTGPPPRDENGKIIGPPRWPFNVSRRAREALLYTASDYGDVSPAHPSIAPLVKGVPGELATVLFWPAGTSPRHVPPDPPTVIPMPRIPR